MDCNHEIVLNTKKKMLNPNNDNLEDILTCARCSTVVFQSGGYSRLNNAMAEIYQGKGLFKRYQVYIKD